MDPCNLEVRLSLRSAARSDRCPLRPTAPAPIRPARGFFFGPLQALNPKARPNPGDRSLLALLHCGAPACAEWPQQDTAPLSVAPWSWSQRSCGRGEPCASHTAATPASTPADPGSTCSSGSPGANVALSPSGASALLSAACPCGWALPGRSAGSAGRSCLGRGPAPTSRYSCAGSRYPYHYPYHKSRYSYPSIGIPRISLGIGRSAGSAGASLLGPQPRVLRTMHALAYQHPRMNVPQCAQAPPQREPHAARREIGEGMTPDGRARPWLEGRFRIGSRRARGAGRFGRAPFSDRTSAWAACYE